MATKIENLIQSQQQLFSDISHDIRTPLTRQKLAIELARSTDNPGPLLDKLEQQNQVIEDLLDSLLTLLRLDNHNDYEACSLELNSVLTECIAQAEIDLANKSLHIKQDIEPALPVIGNRALLLRAFSNIIANAIKYSPENSDIDISAFRRADQIIVEIQDQGPGIVETELTSALEPFYRADRSRHADTGGYGLGLAIVNKIIQQHGGDATLSNAQPSGLRVILSLPNS